MVKNNYLVKIANTSFKFDRNEDELSAKICL